MAKKESLLRLPQVRARVGISKASIYKLVARGEFPVPLEILGPHTVAWPESEIDKWVDNRIATRKAK